MGLLAALVAATWLLALPQPPGPSGRVGSPAGSSGGNTLQDRWPQARVVSASGRLAGGRAYRPLFYPQVDVSVGTALTDDGSELRLLVRTANGDDREIMRLATANRPQIQGMTAAGDDLVWLVAPDGTDTRFVLYRTNWREPGPPTPLTSDTGRVEINDTRYDVVIADGLVHWAAATAGGSTEVRSVPLAGGSVSVRTVDGAYALSAWPWLTSVGSVNSAPPELRNLVTGERVTVPWTPTEVVWCGPVWCRVMTRTVDGRLARTELMHPDGTARVRVAAGTVSSALTDVALDDRFEILVSTIPDAGADNLKLVLYDLTANRSILLVAAAATVQGRGSVVWWSTGDEPAVTWHALDLRTLR